MWVTLTDSTKQNAGLIITDEVKQWIVNQVTENAKSKFNIYYGGKVTDFDNHVTEKTNEFNTNATNKVNEYNHNAESLINRVAECEEENERLRNDIKSIALQGEASGENIHIEDSSNARCEIEIGGNHVQDTREGYNLLDLSNFSTQTKNGVTATKNEDGSIKLVGTNSGDTFNFNLSTTNGEIGDYIASGVMGGSRETYFLGIGKPGVKTFAEVTNGSSNFSLTEETTIAANIYIIKGVTINTTIYPMMIKGTEQKPYEQYGASPSIDYPSKVKSVNGSAKTDISNKNYLSKIPKKSITAQGVTSTFDGEKFICKGTAQTNYFNLFTEKVYKKIGKGIKTLSTNKLKKGRVFIRFDYVDGTYQSYYTSINTNQVGFTLNKDVESYRLNVDSITAGDTIDDNIYVQLEDGRIVTEIEKAENQEYLVDVQQEMLEGDTFVKQDGKWYEKHNWRKEIIDGVNKAINAAGTHLGKTWARYNGGTWDTSKDVYNTLEKIKCTHFKVSDSWEKNTMYGKMTSIGMAFQFMFEDDSLKTIIDVNKVLKAQYDANIPLVVYYLLAEPELIECTEAQSKVLDEIYNKAHTYKNITNISAESAEVNPIVNVKYLKDTEKYIEDKITTALTEINANN